MTEQIQTDWVAWFERDENGLITCAGVDNDNPAEQYNVCVTTSLDCSESPLQTLKIEDPEVYNRVVIQETNLIAAASFLRQTLERLLNVVRRTDGGDDCAWPERDAAMEEADALLTSFKANS
jgi:hypothetical protein